MIADARDRVTDALDGLTGVDVVGYPQTPEQLTRPRVIVAVVSVTPPNVAVPMLTTELAVWCVAALTEPGAADDAADELCERVLVALDAAGIPWTTAERAVYADTNPAYRVTVEVRQA